MKRSQCRLVAVNENTYGSACSFVGDNFTWSQANTSKGYGALFSHSLPCCFSRFHRTITNFTWRKKTTRWCTHISIHHPPLDTHILSNIPMYIALTVKRHARTHARRHTCYPNQSKIVCVFKNETVRFRESLTGRRRRCRCRCYYHCQRFAAEWKWYRWAGVPNCQSCRLEFRFSKSNFLPFFPYWLKITIPVQLFVLVRASEEPVLSVCTCA